MTALMPGSATGSDLPYMTMVPDSIR
jgi:hypothetical protein